MEIMVTFVLFVAIMLIMAIGVMFNRPTLKGSCGGVGGNCPCADEGTPNACKIPNDGEASDGESGVQLIREADDGVKLYG